MGKGRDHFDDGRIWSEHLGIRSEHYLVVARTTLAQSYCLQRMRQA